jgi:ketosteroid isomerase-like protein
VSTDLALVARGYAAFDAGDFDAVVALAAPDIHAHIPMTMANAGDYHGPDEYRLMLERWTSVWGEWRNELEDVTEVSPGVIVIVLRFIARGAGSGAPVDQTQAQVITVRDNLLASWRLFPDRESAMQHAATL